LIRGRSLRTDVKYNEENKEKLKKRTMGSMTSDGSTSLPILFPISCLSVPPFTSSDPAGTTTDIASIANRQGKGSDARDNEQGTQEIA